MGKGLVNSVSQVESLLHAKEVGFNYHLPYVQERVSPQP